MAKRPAQIRPAQSSSSHWQARRQEAEQLFRAGERQAAVARILGISRQCVHNWFWQWQQGGPGRGPSPAARSGRRRRLTAPQLMEIDAALRRGPRAYGFTRERWTLWRIAAVIERITGIAYHPSSVWRLLRTMGWTLKDPPRGQRRRTNIRQWAAPARGGADPATPSET
jgi:transposase